MRSRQYLFALVDGGGNVPPELHAVRRLIERGHAVTVLADDSVASEVHSTGAAFRPWVRAPNRADRRPENDPARDWECRYPWQLVDRLVQTLLVGPAANYASDLTVAMDHCRPALVVCSMFCLGGMLAAEAAHVPYVVLFPNVYPLPARGMPPFGLGLRPARGPIGRFRDRVLNGCSERLWDSRGLADLNTLRRRHRLAPLNHLFDQVRGARRQLVMTSPAFDFPATLPDGARYVGPVLDDPVWSQTSSWTPPAGSDPLILVAMSTTFQDQIGPLQRVIAALSTAPVRAVVTAGPAVDAGTLNAAPNVTVLPHAPHREVLRHAAAVVTHGGHGTVVKALAAGVPLVLLPHGRDQGDTAVRVTARGAGIALRRTADPAAIAAAVRGVLQDPAYRTAAEQLGESVRRDADSAALVRELEDGAEMEAFTESRFDRREFLSRGSAGLIHCATAGLARAQETIPQFRSPLPAPPVLQPVRRDSTADYYEITQTEASVEIIPGLRTRIWGYNGIFPGPTIEARRGRRAVVTHTNRLRLPTVAHLHGGVTRPESDGFPTDTVAPGETRAYEYDNVGRPATLWYHDHAWRSAGRNLYMGLAGLYLLKEDSELDGRLPNGPYDVPLILQDRAFTADGELDYDHDGHRGAAGRVMLVNGAPWPVLEVAARKYRFRILNASNATAMRLALSTHQPLIQIGSDQGMLSAPVVLPAIGLTMGERVEIVVDFSRYSPGTHVELLNRRGEGRLRSVMRFDVVRAARDDGSVPDRLSEIEPLGRPQAALTRTFVFGGKPRLGVPPGVHWVINGKPFDPLRVDASPRLGDIELWRFVNRAFAGRTMLHPVHAHLAPFQVLSRNGRLPLRQEGGWKDTVAIDDGEEVEVIIRWSGYQGRYLLHCHNLEHEDHSMMARVDVV